MYAARLTQPLLRKVGSSAGDNDASTTTALGDWFIRQYNIGRHRLLLSTSSASLLTVIVPARDLSHVAERLSAAVHELLFALGAPLDQINREIGEMQHARFAGTNSRSILGSMNDMAYLADGYLEGYAIPDHLLVAELRMAQAPCGPLRYRSPDDVALELLRNSWQ
jgi:hypothetical protein